MINNHENYGQNDLQDQFGLSLRVMENLCRYEGMLQKWQRKINLVGPKTLDDFWRRHILDSLQIIKHIPETAKILVDLGSGAGLPGIILAIAADQKTDFNVHLVESDQRKAVFLREVNRETNAGVTVHCQRIENIENLNADVITARALAPLENLLKLSQHIQHKASTMLFLKGENYQQELTQADKSWTMNVSEIPSLSGGSGCLLKIKECVHRG